MTAETTDTAKASPEMVAEIAAILAETTGENAQWAARITPNAALEGDLGLESVDLVEFGARLRHRYGDRVDLPAFVAGLDIDDLVGLTVGTVAEHVATATGVTP
jgi:acyl carrier protein